VFAQAREKAREATCISNMRQMGMAALMYAGDYDERIPLAATATATSYLNWHDLMDPYARSNRIWLCPSANLPAMDVSGKPVCHYGLNSYYLNQGVTPAALWSLNNAPGIPLAEVDQPAHTVEMCDTRGTDDRLPANHLTTYVLPPSQQDADYWGRPDPRHSAGVVVTLMDGHTKWFTPGGFYTGQNPPDTWFQLIQP
ncbi:MAG TPA: DUF1559 domain-containing protein, partial [Chthonomonadales bacterium]|nr:DUF1559 domain-containing protein [Chthonomonadales bacterium]